MRCDDCGLSIDVSQPVKYHEGIPYIECACGWRWYDYSPPDEEDDDGYQEYLAAAQGA